MSYYLFSSWPGIFWYFRKSFFHKPKFEIWAFCACVKFQLTGTFSVSQESFSSTMVSISGHFLKPRLALVFALNCIWILNVRLDKWKWFMNWKKGFSTVNMISVAWPNWWLYLLCCFIEAYDYPSFKFISLFVQSIRIGSFSGPYFPAFGLNTEMYFVNFCIQSECGKIRTRKNPNTYNFYTMFIVMKFFGSMITKIKSIAIERPSWAFCVIMNDTLV